MGQILKILILAGIVALIIHKIRQYSNRDEANQKPDKLDKPMTACAVCGTYIPANEALQHGGKSYCSAEHRDEDNS